MASIFSGTGAPFEPEMSFYGIWLQINNAIEILFYEWPKHAGHCPLFIYLCNFLFDIHDVLAYFLKPDTLAVHLFVCPGPPASTHFTW
jgi:hypothetical protein